ncbi:GH3 auxin-responsive promoter family protein [Clostridiales bacterium BAD-6]|uniref:GH3 auxin-responsive promoter family protein n=1 Tax=Sinanaerobacter chloroacetimidivorans TaxID=2818044 RepID=A0A8J8B412_9FIRM|nr:GH3 auxin-responsive promoter family protein [Sinanaerobacter chloroacetimidivorans]MBR0598870.1 GH3 auxin-responsive promoter family protein [Sinanaerobacter chloroacetimidivorans]
MKFEDKLKMQQYDRLWQEYCGFLDLDIDSYMQIQYRLMLEQISLWSESELGKQMLKGKQPKTIDEFRKSVPLTTYIDYADVLLQKKGDMLPDQPIIWIQTTWEGGKHPIKLAPYTKSMLETYRNNVLACLMLSTSTEKGKFNVRATDKFLYALAPLPYATGLFPLALNDEISIEFLPPVKEAVKMSFGERNKKGFKLGLRKGIDFFFGLGSVAYYVSLSLSSMGRDQSKASGSSTGGSSKSLFRYSPSMLLRFALAKYRCKKEGRDLKPKDLFKLKGFMCAGTDNHCYKDDLEDLWGIRPMELFAGTEPSCIGTETWTRNGMYFFPDTCFYEFIPEDEMNKSLDDSSYQPKTYLMNEVVPGEKYEIAISVLKGGAFVRYRVGDVYRCVGLESSEDKTRIPRFQYVDRIPTIIDIAGFTRISEHSIRSVVELSGLAIENWIAVKEYNKNNRPLLHMYVEMNLESLVSSAISKEILREHLGVYFKYVDHDYKDLKHILGMDPLEITILKCGTFEEYKRQTGKTLRHINPSSYEIMELLRIEQQDFRVTRGRGV